MDKLARVDFSRYQSSSRSSLEDLWQVLRDLTAQVDEVQSSVDRLERSEKKAFITGFVKQAVNQWLPGPAGRPNEEWSKNIMKQAPTQQKAVQSAVTNQTAQPVKPPATQKPPATPTQPEITPGTYPGQLAQKAQNITDLQNQSNIPQVNAPDMGLNI